MPDLQDRIDHCLEEYLRGEKKGFDLARRYYRGKHWKNQREDVESAADMRTAYNLIYAIAEAAVVNLIGAQPAIDFQPRNMAAYERGYLANAWMEWAFDTVKIRRRGALAVLDACLCKRGIFKTAWDFERDEPVVRAIDPATVFFDPDVRDQDDSSFWLHATAVHEDEYRARVEAGMYPELTAVSPTPYPEWIEDSMRTTRGDRPRSSDKYYEIWEHYDLRRGKVQHYLRKPGTLLHEDDLEYNPFSMFFLNHSGVDIRGISEVQLLLGYQRKINDMLTLIIYLAYRTIPRVFYDAREIVQETIDDMDASDPAAWVPLKTRGNNAAGFKQLFFPTPTPENPGFAVEIMRLLETLAGKTSALAHIARAPEHNVRTAAQVQDVRDQERGRMAYREQNFHEALEDVAQKMFFLGSKYMARPKFVRIAGAAPNVVGVAEALAPTQVAGAVVQTPEAIEAAFRAKLQRKFRPVNLADLQGIEADFKVVSYSGTRNNPLIMLEALQNILGPVAELKATGHLTKVNLDGIVEEIFRRLDFPPHTLNGGGGPPPQPATPTAPPATQAAPPMPGAGAPPGGPEMLAAAPMPAAAGGVM